MADAGQKHDRDGQPINLRATLQDAIQRLIHCETLQEEHQAEIKALEETHKVDLEMRDSVHTQDMDKLKELHQAELEARDLAHQAELRARELAHQAEMAKSERVIVSKSFENNQLRARNFDKGEENQAMKLKIPLLEAENQRLRAENQKLHQQLDPSQPQPLQSSPSHGVFVDMDLPSCAAKYWPWIHQLATRVGYTAEVLPLSAQPPSDTSQTLVFYVVYSSGPRLEGFANQVRYMELRQQYENVVLLVLRHGNNPTAFEAEGIINDDKWPSGVKGIKGALQFVFKGDIYSPEKCELLEVTQTYNATNLENLTLMVNAIKSS